MLSCRRPNSREAVVEYVGEMICYVASVALLGTPNQDLTKESVSDLMIRSVLSAIRCML